jgi:glycosyltransferase involved in cell wall biosynthesis
VRILFIHQNLPAQFGHLIRHFAASGAHNVVCISRRKDFIPPGAGRVVYDVPQSVLSQPNGFLSGFDAAVRHGIQVARAAETLASKGFHPDIVVGHPGWGETLYLKEVFPSSPILNYCEFFYRTHGADVNFDPASQQDLARNAMTRSRNAHLLLALETADWGMAPTLWQKSVHPAAYLDRISVRFDGIDTDRVAPDPSARLTLPDGSVAQPGDPIVTYVARGLEPYRGFPSFMRAIPAILRGHPTARVVIVGADETFYGPPPGPDLTWRQALTREVAPDPARVHFLGRVPFETYRNLLLVSAAHVYLTVPFVLSWSMLEAMAAGCVVIASDTQPVREALTDGRDGFLVNYFNPDTIAERVLDALRRPDAMAPIRQAARWTALSRYSLARCLPRQVALIEALATGRSVPEA